jgi:glycosyltransferase involved in cell wall biosynthesis
MNAADFLCLPSINEGLSNVIIEAISCGLPVIASKVGGIPEIVTDKKLGVLVTPRSAESLAQGIKFALQEKWDRNAISSYDKIFSWQENALRLFEIIFK